MKILSSALGNVYSGPADAASHVIDELQPSSVFILADENTASLCVPRLLDLSEKSHLIHLYAGEHSKTLASCQTIWTTLIEKGADRDAIMINVGGGMICDIGGFAASCYQRGIRFAHMPTTVLAMADAAFGGKTGIDFMGLKNYIGVIRVPTFIWIDDSFLETLPLTEKISGLAEIVKHAVIGSPELWDILRRITTIEDIPWKQVLEKNLPVKLNVVEADPTEKGIRKVLNFGHTVGHALESYFLSKNIPVPHGNCIATGILTESRIANAIGLLNNDDFKSIVSVVNRLLDPVMNSLPTFTELTEWMIMDKKKSKGRIGFSLPDRIGSCGWDIPVEEKVVMESFEWLTQANPTS